jgi:RimJ/RimL family protein N-acetyltransferase
MKKATVDDIKAIVDFSLELKIQDAKMSFTSFETEEIIRKELNDPDTNLYIALDEGVVTAMFRAIRGKRNKNHSCYVACAVRKAYRKQNLATDLTQFGLDDMKLAGVKIARTKIYSWNTASINTIKKCGFVESGRVYMHQYEESIGGYIDDLIFHKVL